MTARGAERRVDRHFAPLVVSPPPIAAVVSELAWSFRSSACPFSARLSAQALAPNQAPAPDFELLPSNKNIDLREKSVNHISE